MKDEGSSNSARGSSRAYRYAYRKPSGNVTHGLIPIGPEFPFIEVGQPGGAREQEEQTPGSIIRGKTSPPKETGRGREVHNLLRRCSIGGQATMKPSVLEKKPTTTVADPIPLRLASGRLGKTGHRPCEAR